ncbi:hypothetical protein CN918_30290 [Priestia megaterium]|nr:hypothetical protein CN918_30290 [Priestia megaterium]
MTNIQELEKWRKQIHEVGTRFGLDYYDMVYELVPTDVMYMFGSYGMPNRFHHWRFGKRFARMQKMQQLGLMKIYELVINTNPCYAFLLENNTLLENKLIMAHVLGHSDFFKNNRKFKGTNTRMLDEMKIHANKMKEYEQQHGIEAVEKIIDMAMSIEEQTALTNAVLESPKLQEWEKHIVRMIQTEFTYFSPQMETKIINEGWATYWHVRIMQEILDDEQEIIDYAKMHSMVVKANPKSINPYLLGYKIFEDIERRYGREKIFEVRELDSDITFIRQYLTEEVATALNMFTYKSHNRDENIVWNDEMDIVKFTLIQSMINKGYPVLTAHHEEKEFVITHHADSRKLNQDHLEKVLALVYPYLEQEIIKVHTKANGEPVKLVYDGVKLIFQKYVNDVETKWYFDGTRYIIEKAEETEG